MHGSGANANVTWDLWYDNNEGIKKNSTAQNFEIDWDDTIMDVSFKNSTKNGGLKDQYINISKDSNAEAYEQSIWLNVSQGFEEFGSTDDFDSGLYEVFFSSNSTRSTPSIDLSGRDYQAMTAYGTIIGDDGSTIEKDLDADKVVIYASNNKAQAVVAIGAGTQVTGGAAVEPALVTEASASSYSKLILVGGPCVNTLTAEYMGLTYPACETASTILENKGVIKLVEKNSKSALIVARWEKADTARAAGKLGDAKTAGGSSYIVS